jgi:CRP-like cAMP-binding protein
MIAPEELKSIEFLRGLGEAYLNQVSGMAALKECEQDTILFKQAQNSPCIYVVLSGKVGLSIEEPGGNAVEVSRVGPGELLGWSPVLGRQAMTATARTVTPCRLAVFDSRQVLDLCQRDPRFGFTFLREIALVLSERLWGVRRNLARALSHRELISTLPEGSD